MRLDERSGSGPPKLIFFLLLLLFFRVSLTTDGRS